MSDQGAPTPQKAGELRYGTPAGRWVIAATVAGSGMVALDSTIVGIALPAIGIQFHSDVASLQWIATGYLLTLAGLLLLGGALGDRYGRRRIFVVGVIWFALSSLLCGIAPNATMLIFARCLQGIGGALLTPGSLAILQSGFTRGDRSKAIGAWSGLGGVATAIGPLLGGYLITAVSWRLIFFINLPVAFAVVLLAVRHVPETRDPHASGRVDLVGALAVTVGLIGLTYGIVEGPSNGWGNLRTIAALVLGAASGTGFVLVERHKRHPLLPLDVFTSRQFNVANIVTFVVYGALGGALFLLPIDLEQVAHYRPVQAGLSLLPVTIIMLLLSARSGAVAARIGPRLQMGVGPLFVAAGLGLLVRIDASGSYLSEVLPAAVIFGLGLAITVAPLTATVLAAAPSEHAGVASAVNNDVARAAGLVAIAALPPLVGLSGASYLHPQVFSHGFHEAVIICAGLCVIGGVLALVGISNHLPGTDARDVSAPGSRVSSSALDAPPSSTTATVRDER